MLRELAKLPCLRKKCSILPGLAASAAEGACAGESERVMASQTSAARPSEIPIKFLSDL